MVCLNRDTRKRTGMPDIYFRSCYWCRGNFSIPRNVYRGKVKLGQKSFFCSVKCLDEWHIFAGIARRMKAVQESASVSKHTYRSGFAEKRTLCKKGHPWAPADNLGRRKRCGICNRENALACYYKRKGKPAPDPEIRVQVREAS